jgi:hypothetical protein
MNSVGWSFDVVGFDACPCRKKDSGVVGKEKDDPRFLRPRSNALWLTS